MQVARWGNSLAVRLPKRLVEQLGLKAGDEVRLTGAGPRTLEVARESHKEEALARMRARGWTVPGYVFDREEANRR